MYGSAHQHRNLYLMEEALHSNPVQVGGEEGSYQLKVIKVRITTDLGRYRGWIRLK